MGIQEILQQVYEDRKRRMLARKIARSKLLLERRLKNLKKMMLPKTQKKTLDKLTYSLTQASELLNIHIVQLRKLCMSGKIAAFRNAPRGKWYVTRPAILGYMRRMRNPKLDITANIDDEKPGRPTAKVNF